MAVSRRASQHEKARDPRAEQLLPVIEPVVVEHGLILEEAEVRSAAAGASLRIVLDYETGVEQVDLDTVAAVSESLSEALDDADALSDLDDYELEVSTPGATRPLTEPRHYARNVGRLLEIEREGLPPLVARLQEVSESDIRVVEQKQPPKKGMPVRHGDPVDIPLASVDRARVQVEFSHTE
ncbi:MAG: ribosome maturation factor RimP [Nesterenkonia sp.]|uniref:ribosome maturation factor RimP n=1 Tax=Nesterenkonia marinintestina TaxID=2979865 RepID=UPI0021BED09F|nr:ribosome maturation factor RimP [Nesterenkonia sp. GX14115]MDO5493715.1 ribosome maturation factor RimP [Nesterenkonia sp.]